MRRRVTGAVSLTSLRIEYDGLTMRSPLDDDIDPLMAVYDDSFDLHPGQRAVADLATARKRILNERIRGMRYPHDRYDWNLELIVETEPGAVLGWASLYPQNRSSWDVLETSSWVERGQRGHHHSRTMRQGLLALTFDGLGAHIAVSRARADSRSNGTSKRLGYRTSSSYPDSDGYWNWFLTKPEWEATRQSGIMVDGYQSFLDWLLEQP
jgi:hypothetical protein